MQIEVNTDYQGAIRFPAWVCLTIFSGVCMVAAATELPSDQRGSEERWTITVAAISMSVSAVATLLYLFARGIFLGSPIAEGVMVRKTS